MTRLKRAEYEMFTFFEMTPDLICIAGKDGFFRKVNPSVIEKLEYTEEELFARPIHTFIHPDDKEVTARRRAQLLKGKALIDFQNRYVTKTGKTIWLNWTSVYFPEQEVVFAIAKDVTGRKETEKEIEEKYTRFKSLANHFKKSLEKDRKYLAMELHEELAQLASVIKTDIDWLNETLRDVKGMPTSAKNRIEHAMAASDLLINTIRRISFLISPNMLQDLGLNETLKLLCKEFTLLKGIPCVYESECDEMRLTQEVKLDFFRICQEALSNVINHTQAHSVNISIKDTGGEICLCIADDGEGFDLESQKHPTGLVNMRERAASINGQLTIQRENGKGTRLIVTAPGT